MRQTIHDRLNRLEAPTIMASTPPGAVVIYDAETGLPLAPIPQTATTLVWIPDNHREDNEYEPKQ